MTLNSDSNYNAIIVSITNKHDLPGSDRIKGTNIFGNHVIIAADTQIGDQGVFFPVESQISDKFLKANNLYAKAELNADPKKKGFFESSRRVKALRLRGNQSSGFWMPTSALTATYGVLKLDLKDGLQLNTVEGDVLSQKYEPEGNQVLGINPVQLRKTVSRLNLIEQGQFAFHYDTSHFLRQLPFLDLQGNEVISVTSKLHGTSAVFGNLLCKRSLTWYERLLQKLGAHIQTHEYKTVWSSRTMIKGVEGSYTSTGGFYKEGGDVWQYWASKIGMIIPKGYTLYGEIVGWTPGGSPIQKGFTFGLPKGSSEFMIYRITVTNQDGVVTELTWPQIKEFTTQTGIAHVPEVFYGQILNWVRENTKDVSDNWLTDLENAVKSAVEDRQCVYNAGMPAEGIVIALENGKRRGYKAKSFAFLMHETKILDTEAAEKVSLKLEAERIIKEDSTH